MPIATESTFYAHQNDQLSRARERLLKSQGEVISRRRVERTDDDPPAAAWAMEATSDLNRLRRDRLGATQLEAEYRDTEQALAQAIGIVTQARSEVIRARSSGLNASNMQIIASKVGSLASQMQSTMNTYGRGHYLFAGSLDNLPPFDAAGVYTGNAVVRQVEVEPGLRLPMNLPGSQVFNVVGGENVLGVTLNTLSHRSRRRRTIGPPSAPTSTCLDAARRAGLGPAHTATASCRQRPRRRQPAAASSPDRTLYQVRPLQPHRGRRGALMATQPAPAPRSTTSAASRRPPASSTVLEAGLR